MSLAHSGCTYDLQHRVHGHATHCVSVSLSMQTAMCTTVTTGNFELIESSKIGMVTVHGA